MDVSRFERSPLGHLVPLSGTDGRTGAPFDHVAYVADPLGGEPVLRSSTWHAVTAAHRALARLDRAAQQIPVPELLLSPTLRREAQSTSALEGTFAPLESVFEGDLAPIEGRSEEVSEVLNYVAAATDAFGWMVDRGTVTVGLLEHVHKVLVRGTRSESADSGRLRTTPVVIGSSGGSVAEARFVPMPPGQGLAAAVQALVEWIVTPTESQDPLVAAGMAHYQFETLHPFNDGNGRIGRLLIVLHFLHSGLLHQPLLSVSPWFERRRAAYQDHLAEVSATGDWDSWLSFFAQGVEQSAIDTAERVDKLLAIQRQYVEQVVASGARGVIRDIAALLIGLPWVTVPVLAERLGVTQQAVNVAVRRLVDLKILSGPIGRYNRMFYAPAVAEVLRAQ